MLRIINGDLLAQPVDAIVNPANSFLRHGGGLARIIHEAASEPTVGENIFRPTRYDEELFELQQEPVPVGEAVLQRSTGPLPFKGIIHAVGPIWGGGRFCEAELLRLAYQSAANQAEAHGFKSVAFPAISAGIFGVPMNVVAAQGVLGLKNAVRNGLDITVCLTNDEDTALWRDIASGVYGVYEGEYYAV